MARADRAELRHLTQIAAQYALAIRNELRDYTAVGGERLSLKVAVGAERVQAFHIGGVFRRWKFAVCGAPGDVALSCAAEIILTGLTVTKPLPVGCFKPINLKTTAKVVATQITAAKQADVQPLKSLIPAAIHQRLEAGQSVWLGELRSITLLFVSLPGLTAQTPIEEAHRAMRTLLTALYSNESSVNKLSADDKGVSLIAALGLPPLAHNDDPTRRTLAALAMHRGLGVPGWQSSIGVTTGRVFCSTFGNERRREYTIMGDTVNLSTGPMQAGNGGILCDTETQLETNKFVEFATLKPIAVKGKDGVIAVFEPKAELNLDTHGDADLSFVGRRSER